MFRRRILAELRAVEAQAVALRDALSMIAPNPWDLAFAKRVFADPFTRSTLHDFLA